MKGLTPIILILISIASFFLFIDPKYKEIKELKQERDSNEEMLVLAEQLQRKRDVLREEFNAISEDEKEDLKKLLPDTVDNVKLIVDINDIALAYGIKISDITINSEEEGSSNQGDISKDSNLIGKVGLGFSINTTYDIYLQFLRDLEEALRVVDINTLDIATSDRVDFYNFQIDLETYWLR